MIGRKQPPVAAETDQPRGFDAFELRLGDVMRGERATLGKSLLDVQRELKIKATYIAAIENADPTAFETPGFVAGYVRSYARYLGLDPEWAYQSFCAEGDFAVVHGMDAGASTAKSQRKSERKTQARGGDPLGDPNAVFVPRGEALFARIQPGAVGSALVLLALIGGLGFGGWSVLKEIQQVRLTPVDEAPGVIAEVDPLASAAMLAKGASDDTGVISPSADALDRLYRPQALDVPVLVARDGPISTLKPGSIGALAPEPGTGNGDTSLVAQAMPNAALPNEPDPAVKVVGDVAPEVVVFAVRPAWVRVRAVDGSVLFEKILDAGERYVLPQTEEPPTLRAGNSGSVYFAVNGETYGPAAPGAQVAKDIVLSADALSQTYQLADLSKDPDLASAVAVAEASAIAPAVTE